MSNKTLEEKANELARRRVKKLIDELFQGNQGRAARAFRIQQGSLSDFLAGKRGAGSRLIKGIASVSPEDALAILGLGAGTEEPDRRAVEAHVMLGVSRGDAVRARDYLRSTSKSGELRSERDWFDALDAILRALSLPADSVTKVTFQPDPTYPARGEAVFHARMWGYPEHAIARVQARDDLSADPGLEFWLDELRFAKSEGSTPAPPSPVRQRAKKR